MLHIEIRKLAACLLIAPLSANTLAKMANGLCDNLLTNIFRCWPFDDKDLVAKPVVVAPAMNTCMFEHPLTRRQLKQLGDFGVTVLDTQAKTLVCGDTGKGGMASVSSICESIKL